MSPDEPTRPPEPARPDQHLPGSPSAPVPGRDRLRRALWTPSSAQVVVAVLLAVLGFAAVTQVRATQVDDSFAGYREQELIDVLNGLAGASQRSQAEIARLEAARDELQSTSSRRRTALEQAQIQADSLRVLAGLVPVTGPGLRVTIREISGQVRINSVLDLVQELRTVGAEAIQVNDEVRLVAQSSFEQTDEGLVIDGTQLRAPYVLEAIGDPDTLAGALPFPGGPRDQLVEDGAEVDSKRVSSLEIRSVRGAELGAD